MNNQRTDELSREERRQRQFKQSEDIANENAPLMSNGNRDDIDPDDRKGSDAQHGGPGLKKAHDRQPPESTRPDEKSFLDGE